MKLYNYIQTILVIFDVDFRKAVVYNVDILQKKLLSLEIKCIGREIMEQLFNDSNKKIIPMVKFLLPTLTSSEKKAAEYLLEHPEKVSKLSLVNYADYSGSSQASIIRLCKRIGVSGYSELKATLSVQLVSSNGYDKEFEELEKGGLGDNMIQIMKNVFKVNIEILKETFALANEEYNKAFEAILNAKQLCFFAIGDAMIPCEYACFKFRRLGYICFAEKDCDLQMITACHMKPGDVAIAISHSGRTRQVVDAMEIAKRNGATTICITKREKSELIKYCDIKLFTATPDISVGQEIIARRISEQAILEAIYFGVLQYNEPNVAEKIRLSSEAMKANKL